MLLTCIILIKFDTWDLAFETSWLKLWNKRINKSTKQVEIKYQIHDSTLLFNKQYYIFSLHFPF